MPFDDDDDEYFQCAQRFPPDSLEDIQDPILVTQQQRPAKKQRTASGKSLSTSTNKKNPENSVEKRVSVMELIELLWSAKNCAMWDILDAIRSISVSCLKARHISEFRLLNRLKALIAKSVPTRAEREKAYSYEFLREILKEIGADDFTATDKLIDLFLAAYKLHKDKATEGSACDTAADNDHGGTTGVAIAVRCECLTFRKARISC